MIDATENTASVGDRLRYLNLDVTVNLVDDGEYLISDEPTSACGHGSWDDAWRDYARSLREWCESMGVTP